MPRHSPPTLDAFVAHHSLASRCRTIEGSAQALPYPGATFDVLLGLGALHYLVRYLRVAEDLARVTKSGGVIVFQETWRENPILRALRARFTQFTLDAGDAQVTRGTLEVWAGGRFSIRVEHRTLLYAAERGWRPPRGRPTSNRFLGALKWVDEHFLLRLAGLRRWGAQAVVVLEPTGSHQDPDLLVARGYSTDWLRLRQVEVFERRCSLGHIENPFLDSTRTFRTNK